MFYYSSLPVINKWNKMDNSIFHKTNCKKIVVFNSKLNNTLGLPRVTKYLRYITCFKYIKFRYFYRNNAWICFFKKKG